MGKTGGGRQRRIRAILTDDKLSPWGRFMRKLILAHMIPDEDGSLPDSPYAEVVEKREVMRSEKV